MDKVHDLCNGTQRPSVRSRTQEDRILFDLRCYSPKVRRACSKAARKAFKSKAKFELEKDNLSCTLQASRTTKSEEELHNRRTEITGFVNTFLADYPLRAARTNRPRRRERNPRISKRPTIGLPSPRTGTHDKDTRPNTPACQPFRTQPVLVRNRGSFGL